MADQLLNFDRPPSQHGSELDRYSDEDDSHYSGSESTDMDIGLCV